MIIRTGTMAWSGYATMAAGLLFAVVEVAERLVVDSDSALSIRFTSDSHRLVEASSWLYMLLLILAVPAIHARQRAALGRVGSVPYVFLMVSLVLTLGSLWSAVAVFPEIAPVAPAWVDTLDTSEAPTLFAVILVVSLFAPAVAIVVYAGLSIKAATYPRPAWALVAVGFLALPFVPILAPVVVGVGFAWIGATLLTADDQVSVT